MGSSVILPQPGQPTQGPDRDFRTASIPSAVGFRFDAIGPPSSLYVQQDDILQLSAVSSLATDTVTFRVRFLHVALPVPGQPDTGVTQTIPVAASIPPYIGLYEFTVVTAVARTFVTFQRSLGEGFILSVDAVALNALTRGVTFARAEIFRGPSSSQQFAQLFISDYVDINASTSWPGSSIHHYLEGPGFLHSLQQANPAAGADWILTVANKQRLRIESFCATFTASATAANRQVEVIIDDGANIYWRTSSAVNITAGQVVAFCATTTNAPAGLITTDNSVVLPPTIALPSGHRIRTATTGIQAGDQWSNIWFGVEEWVDF